MKKSNIELHKGIQALLLEKKISQKELSHRIGLSESYVSRIVRGERQELSMNVIYNICQVLGVTINSLILRSLTNTHPNDKEISRLTKAISEKFKELDFLMEKIHKRVQVLR
jgi:transcriptional regulator with XRE-family HTH domain